MNRVPSGVAAFLRASTPARWVSSAAERLPELLNDHANCEKKAASSALALMFRYPKNSKLVSQMSRLAREELRHFEQVHNLMEQCGIAVQNVAPSAYARRLREATRGSEPGRLIDTLIVGALIEARSCERFALLIPVLPEQVSGLYSRLLASEARHFECYLALAQRVGVDVDQRVDELATLEAQLAVAPDTVFAFHSGAPAA